MGMGEQNKQGHLEESQGTPGQQFLVKPFILQAQTSVPAQHCAVGKGLVVALGPKGLGDTSSDFCSLTSPCNLK